MRFLGQLAMFCVCSIPLACAIPACTEVTAYPVPGPIPPDPSLACVEKSPDSYWTTYVCDNCYGHPVLEIPFGHPALEIAKCTLCGCDKARYPSREFHYRFGFSAHHRTIGRDTYGREICSCGIHGVH